MAEKFDLTTQDGVVKLMRSSKDSREWNANCDAVKAANSGDYPDFWYVTIMMSGLAQEVADRWGDPTAMNIKITTFKLD